MLSEALFAERRTWARAVRRLAFFARQERTFGGTLEVSGEIKRPGCPSSSPPVLKPEQFTQLFAPHRLKSYTSPSPKGSNRR